MLGRVGYWSVIWSVIWSWPWPSFAQEWARRLPVAGVASAGACGLLVGDLVGDLGVALAIIRSGMGQALAGGWRGQCWAVWVTGR
ncbi:hypothetical protein [Craterilacuibacter sinensis]|uniref:Uncharacterized protein n=1 Tax=Craterilacuibacter sinensis TaxID=2686017 RepID=A0A845BSQ3_9NEIS|nr:hypothetical protein [Craterilacuibacter sinensis]MXR38234.1 hypothetical protein [Craterilacuibacter sinensis]